MGQSKHILASLKRFINISPKKKDIPDKLKNELIKVIQLNNNNNVYVTKELDFIKDTAKFIDRLKINILIRILIKSLNSIVSIISRIKEFDKEYQILAPINTGLAKSHSDDRNDNTVSFTDNKRIINFTPATIKNTLKSISDLAIYLKKQFLVFIVTLYTSTAKKIRRFSQL